MFQPRVWLTRRRSLGMAAGVTVALGVAGAAPALAATTVGQTGTPDTSAYYYGGDEILSPTYSVPAGGGKITSFQTQSSSCETDQGYAQGIYNFQALRPEGGGAYLVLGDTGNQTDPCDSQLHSYPVNITVQSGDVLGVWIVAGWVGILPVSNATDKFELFQSEPSVGQTIYARNTDVPGKGLDESASLINAPALAAQLVADSTGAGRGHTLYEQATAIQTAVKNGQTATACQDIATYLNTVRKSGLNAATAAKLTSDANALAAALGC